MANGPFDWQTVVAGLIGVIAVAHVARRWLGPRAGADAGAHAGGQPPGSAGCPPAGMPANMPASRCSTGSGCGACGSGRTSPPKDHRIRIVRD